MKIKEKVIIFLIFGSSRSAILLISISLNNDTLDIINRHLIIFLKLALPGKKGCYEAFYKSSTQLNNKFFPLTFFI